MKIECSCGALIVDQSDFLAYKATFIADQDCEDAAPAERSMFECVECGRVLIETADRARFLSFTPEEGAPRGVLRSIHGSRWRGFLRGHWGAGSLSPKGGSLWWTCGDGEEGLEEFATWDALEARYRQVFAELRRRDVVRSAFLLKDGAPAHEWAAT